MSLLMGFSVMTRFPEPAWTDGLLPGGLLRPAGTYRRLCPLEPVAGEGKRRGETRAWPAGSRF